MTKAEELQSLYTQAAEEEHEPGGSVTFKTLELACVNEWVAYVRTVMCEHKCKPADIRAAMRCLNKRGITLEFLETSLNPGPRRYSRAE